MRVSLARAIVPCSCNGVGRFDRDRGCSAVLPGCDCFIILTDVSSCLICVRAMLQTLLQCLSETTKRANSLPSPGDDHEFYSTTDGFQVFMQHHAGKILKM